MSKVYGIDLSLGSTGVTSISLDIIDETSYLIVTSPKKFNNRFDRYNHILACMPDLSDAKLVCIEGYSFGSSGNAVSKVAELGSVIRMAMYNNQIPFIEVSPSTLKKFATGSGNADKQRVVDSVLSELASDYFKVKISDFYSNSKAIGIPKGVTDLCDSYVLACIGKRIMKMLKVGITTNDMRGSVCNSLSTKIIGYGGV